MNKMTVIKRCLLGVGIGFIAFVVLGSIPFVLQNLLIGNAATGNLKDVNFLLKIGVDPNVPMIDDWHEGGEALIAAATNGHTEIVKLLIKKGAKIDAGGCCGESALMQAASHGHPDTLKALLAAGANPNFDTGYDESPLQSADGYPEETRILKLAGAKRR